MQRTKSSPDCKANSILVVDDHPAVCDALALMLRLQGHQVTTCLSADEAIQSVSRDEFDLVIQDMNFSQDTTSGEEGKCLFRDLRAIQPDLPIIVLTAWTELDTAVELVKQGHADYMGKPWDDDRLLNSISNLLSLHDLARDNQQLKRQQRESMSAIDQADLCGLVFVSGSMRRCVDLSLQIARSDVPVLITGPNGAGKDKIADIIHANSPLKDKPLVKVNVGALPVDLMEAELFGAEVGAYTGLNKKRIGRFEAADGGTLFLDEIGNLPLSGQIKLLRVLQTGEFERLGSHQTRKVNVRVISATNADLNQAIEDGSFREDLFYRLNVIELNVPPLCQRVDDILPLVNHFTGPDFSISKNALLALQAHSWPGNVRELQNACRRAALLANSHQLQESDFGLVSTDESFSLPRETTKEPDKATIEAALREHRGVITRVAKSLGLSRQALYRRMAKYGIDSDRIIPRSP